MFDVDITPVPTPAPARTALHRWSRLVAVGAVAAVLATAACSSSGSSTPAGSAPAGSTAATGGTSSSSAATTGLTATIDGKTVTTDAALAAAVPAAVRKKGALTDITYNNAPPDESVVNGKTVGWEVDLGQAVATKLGLKWQITTSGAFDGFIPGLQNGRYNTSFTSFIATADRIKQIDIVSYYNVGTGFAVKKGSSISIKAATDLCGHSVAVLEGSAFIQQIKGIDCSGKSKIDVQSFPSDSAAELAVSSGRAEVYSSSSNQLTSLLAQTKGQFVQQSLNFMPTPEGVGITKNIGLTKPVADAIDSLIQDGTYKAIMNKWGITEGLVTHTNTNGVTAQ
jgi:polar amino acid transport system substrate-binding protein